MMDVEKAKSCFRWIIEKSAHLTNAKEYAELGLAALDEPVCKTCGGSGKLTTGNWYCYKCNKKVASKEVIEKCHNTCGTPVLWKAEPCPDCQQPPAGELRERAEQCKVTEDYMAGVDPNEILDLYDRLDRLESRLAKRGEAIKKIIETDGSRWIKGAFKRILGDEEFERIVK